MEKPGLQNTIHLGIAATLLLAGALGFPPVLAAEGIYKSVDADGKVTYSSAPPADAVDTQPVSVPDAPSEAQKRDALQREQQLKRAAESQAQERSASGTTSKGTIKDAQTARDQARTQLKQARVQQDSDWQGLAGGGRRLKESYFERVRKAEENLRQTEDALSKSQRDLR